MCVCLGLGASVLSVKIPEMGNPLDGLVTALDREVFFCPDMVIRECSAALCHSFGALLLVLMLLLVKCWRPRWERGACVPGEYFSIAVPPNEGNEANRTEPKGLENINKRPKADIPPVLPVPLLPNDSNNNGVCAPWSFSP